MKECEKHASRPLVPDQQPAEGPKPGNGPFDDPPMAIGTQAAAILIPARQIVAAVRAGQDDPAEGEPLEEMCGIAAVRSDARGQRRFGEGDSVGEAAVMVIPRGIP